MSRGPTRLFPPDEDQHRRSSDQDIDWQRAAPRWALLLVVAVLLVVAGWALSEVRGGYGRDLARLEQAQTEAPSKYQARLSERIAVVESQASALNGSIQQLSTQIEKQNASTTALTLELRVLTAEIKRRP